MTALALPLDLQSLSSLIGTVLEVNAGDAYPPFKATIHGEEVAVVVVLERTVVYVVSGYERATAKFCDVYVNPVDLKPMAIVWRRSWGGTHTPLPERSCLGCGIHYRPIIENQTFCALPCRRAAANKRRSQQ